MVPGSLLNQFSLSEDKGVLRAASTVGFGAGGGEQGHDARRAATAISSSAAQVGGLGRGERIYAVRFIGDVGYVVTFRQTDPLYTLDLADPAQPARRAAS